MKNANSFNLSNIYKGLSLFLALLFIAVFPLTLRCMAVKASVNEQVYFDDPTFSGSTASIDDSYEIVYDELVVTLEGNTSAPSHGRHENDMQNACAPITGSNVVAFYDRFFTDLIPDYTPGGINPLGKYTYFSDMGLQPVITLIRTLHTAMNSADGTTEAEFKAGMQSFLSSKGRSITYHSFYSTTTNVDLSTFVYWLDQGKVCVLMCSTYNFVSDIINDATSNLYYVVKDNSYVGHMMLVYGYKIYQIYVGGALVRTDTFLLASSGYSDGDSGYILLNDDLTIEKAYILDVT